MSVSALRRPALAIGSAAGLLLLSACGSSGSDSAGSSASGSSGSAGTVTITDAQKRTVKVPTNPSKVVVLDWSAARSLHQLGVKIAGVPKPNGTLPSDLKEAASSAKTVGTLFEPDYEAIAEMDPDLVVVGSRSGNAKVVGELTKITPNVIDMSKRGTSMSEVNTRYTQLASIFGKQAAAKKTLASMDSAVATLRSKAEKASGTTMFVQVSGSKVSAYGPGSRFNTIWTDFGFKAVDAKLDKKGSHGEEINQEFFVKYDPSRILVLDRGRTIGESGKPALDVLNNDLVNRTSAAKNDKISAVDGFSWYLAPSSPASVTQMVTDATKVL